MYEAYVSEPDNIDIKRLIDLLPASIYMITAGTSTFKAGFTSTAEVLVIRSGTKVAKDIKQYFPGLESIIRVGTGLDNIDIEYCNAASIRVYNAPGANADAVAEYVVAAILFASRRLYLLNDKDVLAWNRRTFVGHGLGGRTIGIIGYGNIGRLLHQKLRALSCDIFMIYDPYQQDTVTDDPAVRFVEIEQLLHESDIVSLHLPLNDETHHFMNHERLLMLKEGAILVNAARGGIVDEKALLKILEHNDLIYIADTVENEPHVNPDLINHEQIIVTPHIASLTVDAERGMLRQAVGNYLKDRHDTTLD